MIGETLKGSAKSPRTSITIPSLYYIRRSPFASVKKGNATTLTSNRFYERSQQLMAVSDT